MANIESPDAWIETLRVMDMDDGGMGSLSFVVATSEPSPRRVTVCRAAVQFTDADGVEVIASLNAGEDGVPFELDVWKTDFSRLIRIPDQFRRMAT